ncbi:MAG: CPBP family intramembrane glutamic endopeptidase [Elainellaceae cyanobacterium]
MFKPIRHLIERFGTAFANRPAPQRIALFLVTLLLLWLPLYGLARWQLTDSNTVSVITTAVILLEFLALLRVWSRALYRSRLRDRYGLQWRQRNRREFALGFAVAAFSLSLLFGLETLLGWTIWRWDNWGRLGAIAGEGALVAIGVALGEELVFRGWLLGELEEDYSGSTALWGSSLAFAALHFIKPLSEMVRTAPQFPGLLLLGLVLVWARWRCQGRLGMAVGLHAGLIWSYYLFDVGDLMTYRKDVPEWLTGIDGNPLAGGLGLLFLSGLGLWVRSRRLLGPRAEG